LFLEVPQGRLDLIIPGGIRLRKRTSPGSAPLKKSGLRLLPLRPVLRLVPWCHTQSIRPSQSGGWSGASRVLPGHGANCSGP
jgi:hypothetical protein